MPCPLKLTFLCGHLEIAIRDQRFEFSAKFVMVKITGLEHIAA
jgi:hypothetical protein